MDSNVQKPAMDNLPDDNVDWEEISDFIEYMLEPDIHCRKGWKIINDPSVTKNLQKNSLVVLNTLCNDLYGYFFKQCGDRFKVWKSMESFIYTKYNRLLKKALSRVITRYQIDDR